jgi:hypothetical protein
MSYLRPPPNAHHLPLLTIKMSTLPSTPSTSSRLIFPLLSIGLFLFSLYQLLYSSTHPFDPTSPPFPRPGRGHERPLSKMTIGTLNLRFDGDWRHTIPVGEQGDGRDDVYADDQAVAQGEKVSSSPFHLL